MFRRHHAPVFLEPRVVRRGEVELRNRLEAELLQPAHLRADPVGGARPLDRQFGVARVDRELAEINHHEVHLAQQQMVHELLPQRVVELEVVVAEASVRDFRHALRQRLAPHVVAPVQQDAADVLGLLREGGRGRKRRGAADELSSRHFLYSLQAWSVSMNGWEKSTSPEPSVA